MAGGLNSRVTSSARGGRETSGVRGVCDVVGISLVATMLLLLMPLSARPDVASDAQIWKVLRARDAQGLGQLINQGADVSSPGFLKYAAESDQAGAALMLLRRGADPNGWTTDRYGKNPTGSPVYIAAKRGNREILQLMKEYGARMDAESPTDTSIISTPLLCAVY